MLCDSVHDPSAPDVVQDTVNLSITVRTPQDGAR